MPVGVQQSGTTLLRHYIESVGQAIQFLSNFVMFAIKLFKMPHFLSFLNLKLYSKIFYISNFIFCFQFLCLSFDFNFFILLQKLQIRNEKIRNINIRMPKRMVQLVLSTDHTVCSIYYFK